MITLEQRKIIDAIKAIKEKYPTIIDLRGKYIYQNNIYRPEIQFIINNEGTRIKLVMKDPSGHHYILADTKNEIFRYLLDHDMEIRD